MYTFPHFFFLFRIFILLCLVVKILLVEKKNRWESLLRNYMELYGCMCEYRKNWENWNFHEWMLRGEKEEIKFLHIYKRQQQRRRLCKEIFFLSFSEKEIIKWNVHVTSLEFWHAIHISVWAWREENCCFIMKERKKKSYGYMYSDYRLDTKTESISEIFKYIL